MKNFSSPESKFRQGIFQVENKQQQLLFFDPGDRITSPKIFSQNIYFSLRGVVKLSRVYATEQEIFIALLPEQSFFGLPSLFSDQSTQKYQAVALTTVTLISISNFQFQQELQKSPELATLVTQKLLSRLLTAEMTIESRLRSTLEVRLISFLLILSRDFGVSTDSGLEINLQLSHTNLASLINSSRASVSRVLVPLRRQKLISIKKQKITLHNLSALCKYIDFEIPYQSD